MNPAGQPGIKIRGAHGNHRVDPPDLIDGKTELRKSLVTCLGSIPLVWSISEQEIQVFSLVLRCFGTYLCPDNGSLEVPLHG